jgi:hypothetical protein
MPIEYINNDLFKLILKNQQETDDKVECLQRAVTIICSNQSDFKAEYSEDIAEVKRQLQELRKNKVWIPREEVWK